MDSLLRLSCVCELGMISNAGLREANQKTSLNLRLWTAEDCVNYCTYQETISWKEIWCSLVSPDL